MKKYKFWAGVLLSVCTMLLCVLPLAAQTPCEVTLGGVPFGVQFMTKGIFVVGYADVNTACGSQNPARDGGILPGDCILCAGGRPLHTKEELAQILAEADGTLSLRLLREQEEREVTLSIATCTEDGKHRIGLLVRDSGAGIGTVTYVLPQDGRFAGLGHGICDTESGRTIPLARGSVSGVAITDVRKGAVGTPGELRGHFSKDRLGTLSRNTACGVFGQFVQLPAGLGRTVPIAGRDRIRSGSAKLRCTLDGGVTDEYDVEIFGIDRAATGNKCFSIKVTDDTLLARAGGIVQGMSGSPILQDGCLVGAVTHVLIGDPTTGYGIFIENMLAQQAADASA